MLAPLGLVFMTSYWTVAQSPGTAVTTVKEASFPPTPALPSVCTTSHLLTNPSVHCENHSLLRETWSQNEKDVTGRTLCICCWLCGTTLHMSHYVLDTKTSCTFTEIENLNNNSFPSFEQFVN